SARARWDRLGAVSTSPAPGCRPVGQTSACVGATPRRGPVRRYRVQRVVSTCHSFVLYWSSVSSCEKEQETDFHPYLLTGVAWCDLIDKLNYSQLDAHGPPFIAPNRRQVKKKGREKRGRHGGPK